MIDEKIGAKELCIDLADIKIHNVNDRWRSIHKAKLRWVGLSLISYSVPKTAKLMHKILTQDDRQIYLLFCST